MTRQDKIEKKAKFIKIALRVTFIISILVVGYGGSMIYSVLQMDVVYEDIDAVHNDNGSPFDPSDDTYTISIPVINEGFYVYSSFTADAQLIIPVCPGLDPVTVIGVTTTNFTSLNPGESKTFDLEIEIDINATVIAAIAANDPDFEFTFSFAAYVHFFTIFFSGTLPIA